VFAKPWPRTLAEVTPGRLFAAAPDPVPLRNRPTPIRPALPNMAPPARPRRWQQFTSAMDAALSHHAGTATAGFRLP